MIDLGLAITGGVLYFTGRYGLALLLIVLAIISGAGAAVRAIIDPDWYNEKRIQAGLGFDMMGSGVRQLLITKAMLIALLAWAAWHVAEKAGYL